MNEQELAEITEAWLTGRLDRPRREALAAAAAADPVLLAQLVTDARLSAHLDSLLGTGDVGNLAERVQQMLDARANRHRRTSCNSGRRQALAPGGRWRAPRWIASIAALLVIATGFALWAGRTDRAPVIGDVLARIAAFESGAVLRRNGGVTPLEIGMSLHAGDEIDASNGSAIVTLTDATEISCPNGSRIALNASDPGMVELRAGVLRADVRPQDVRHPLRFTTPQCEAVVVGTRLELRNGSSRSALLVYDGHVRMAPAGGGVAVDVGAGQFAVASLEFPPRAYGITAQPSGWIDAFVGDGPDLDGWWPVWGAWTRRAGILSGIPASGPIDQDRCRIESLRWYGDLDLTCALRRDDISDCDIQLHDFTWDILLPAGMQPGWHDLHVSCVGEGPPHSTIDGREITAVRTDGKKKASGPIGFYGRGPGRLEVKDLRIRAR
ncbi:MAG: FecR domain-containing protein [Planctomycetes bacterium]|nr:FecR domain-containing protein [Planctomycetota bacterium]